MPAAPSLLLLTAAFAEAEPVVTPTVEGSGKTYFVADDGTSTWERPAIGRIVQSPSVEDALLFLQLSELLGERPLGLLEFGFIGSDGLGENAQVK